MWTDRKTRQALIVAFRCFSNVPLKHVLHKAIRHLQRNRDSVVGVVTRSRGGWFGIRIPEGANVSLFFKIIHMSFGSTPPPIQCVPVFFPGSKVGCLS